MIWKHFGFSRNIFFVEPLAPNEEDIQLFVGRNEEVKKYLSDVLSDRRALKIVSGDVGVGKTTFVNACQYYSYTNSLPFEFSFDVPKVLPCFEKIQIRESDTLDDFLSRTIVAICQSIVRHCKLIGVQAPKEVRDFLEYFLEMKIGSGGGGVSGGISVMGFGAQVGTSRESKAISPVKNARIHLKSLVHLTKSQLALDGVFVTVNNLDILPKQKLLDFANTARDELFDIEGIYWTLIGRKGIGSVLETEVDRVADYLSGIESQLAALDFDKTKLVIRKRVDFYREDNSVKCPLTDATIEAFYFLSVQELRETLRICGEITKRVWLINPSYDVIPFDKAMSAFMEYAYERTKDLDLSEQRIRLLTAVYERASCRPRDYAKFGYTTVQGFIAALKGLVGKRLLSVEERGRARIYRMTGMTMIAAVTGALGTEIQEVAQIKLAANGTLGHHRADRFGSAQLELELDDQNHTP